MSKQPAGPRPTGSMWPKVAVAAMAGLLIVAMLVSGFFLIKKRSEQSHVADVRSCVLTSAENSVRDLINVTADNVDDMYGSMLAGSTGAFNTQLENSREQYSQLSQEADAATEGTILVSAVEDSDDNGGSVLLVTQGTITNVNMAVPKGLTYRARAEVKRENGVCKTSKVEWVN